MFNALNVISAMHDIGTRNKLNNGSLVDENKQYHLSSVLVVKIFKNGKLLCSCQFGGTLISSQKSISQNKRKLTCPIEPPNY